MKQRIRHRIAIKKTKNCEYHIRQSRHMVQKSVIPDYYHQESTCDPEIVTSIAVDAFLCELSFVQPSEELEVLFIIREP